MLNQLLDPNNKCWLSEFVALRNIVGFGYKYNHLGVMI